MHWGCLGFAQSHEHYHHDLNHTSPPCTTQIAAHKRDATVAVHTAIGGAMGTQAHTGTAIVANNLVTNALSMWTFITISLGNVNFEE